jgi:hypothetical protein
MRSTEEGSRIADTILRDGYIELTDEVAMHYARALSSGQVQNFHAADFTSQGTWDPNREYSDQELEEYFAEVGLRAGDHG